MGDQSQGPKKPPEDERFEAFMLKRAVGLLVALAFGFFLAVVVFRWWK